MSGAVLCTASWPSIRRHLLFIEDRTLGVLLLKGMGCTCCIGYQEKAQVAEEKQRQEEDVKRMSEEVRGCPSSTDVSLAKAILRAPVTPHLTL
jgi:hypothetical protein